MTPGDTSLKTLRGLLSRSPRRSADESLLDGDPKAAMQSFARSGEWQRAAQVAAELKDEEKLVRFSLTGALGRLPPGPLPNALSAAELLSSQGQPAAAVLLFEHAGAFQRAGEAALAAGDPVRASRAFRQAGSWLQAVRCLEEAGKLREAVQMAEDGLRGLDRAVGGAGATQKDELRLARISLLLRLGRQEAALAAVRATEPSTRLAETLARAGQFGEAVQCYLKLGKVEEARRLSMQAPDGDKLRAQIFLHTGQPAEAGHLLAQLGLAREAAEAYEAAQDWSRAAYRWEAADEPRRAAEAYEKAGRPADAARCYLVAGMPQRAAEIGKSRSSGASKTVAAARTVRSARSSQMLDMARQKLAAGDKVQAASLLFQIPPEDPGFTDGTFLLVPLLLEEGFTADALTRLGRLSSLSGQQELEREYWQGRCFETMQQKEPAIVCFERLLGRDPGYRDARARLDALRQGPPSPPAPAPAATTPAAGTATEPMAAPALPTVGMELAGRYEILSEIGKGGMAQVYKARDRELDEIVAIKTLLGTGDEALQEQTRLLREVQICRRINHPNVVRVYDLGRFEGGIFVTMEYLEGTSLDDIIEKEAPLPFARVRSILSDIASGLHEAHSQGITHRDLKPNNIMMTPQRLKILDFGIAAMAGLGSRLTQTGLVMGTPLYIAPDQILGQEPDGRADLYSLGVIGYCLITGREPYEPAEPTLLLLKHLHAVPPPLRRFRPDTPDAWSHLIDRLLAKNRDERYQSAQELSEALAQLPV